MIWHNQGLLLYPAKSIIMPTSASLLSVVLFSIKVTHRFFPHNIIKNSNHIILLSVHKLINKTSGKMANTSCLNFLRYKYTV